MKDAGQVILQTPLEGLANELCEVVKLFYHIDGFSVNPEAVEGESSLLIRHRFERTGMECRCGFAVDGEQQEKTLLLPTVEPERQELIEKRLIKRLCKVTLYELLKGLTGQRPPWGSLTGIRPTRLIYEGLADGLTMDEACVRVEQTFDVLPEKVELLREIVEVQRTLPEPGPEEADLYVSIPFCRTRCAYCSFPGEAVGKGKLPEPEEILQYILRQLAFPHDLVGKKVLVTAGPTQEAIDPVRYLTNHSTGKMGYAIARMAMLRGADVTLVSGPTAITPPPFVTVVPVVSAQDMFEAVAANAPESDFIFKAAAVADYTPANYSDNKVKKSEGDMSIPLKRTRDILKYLGENRVPGQVICGFSMETQNMVENSREKLVKKNVDMICANNLKQSGAGFGVDTNVITIITRNETTELPLQTKEGAANAILDAALRLTP